MRITAEEKEATRERIEAAALDLFRTRGFAATTTRDIAKGQSLGFATGGDVKTGYERMKNKVTEELKQHFRPEFPNRVAQIIVFPPLTQDEIIHMVDYMIDSVEIRMKDRDMALELTTTAKEWLAKRGFDPVLGARPLRSFRRVVLPLIPDPQAGTTLT